MSAANANNIDLAENLQVAIISGGRPELKQRATARLLAPPQKCGHKTYCVGRVRKRHPPIRTRRAPNRNLQHRMGIQLCRRPLDETRQTKPWGLPRSIPRERMGMPPRHAEPLPLPTPTRRQHSTPIYREQKHCRRRRNRETTRRTIILRANPHQHNRRHQHQNVRRATLSRSREQENHPRPHRLSLLPIRRTNRQATRTLVRTIRRRHNSRVPIRDKSRRHNRNPSPPTHLS